MKFSHRTIKIMAFVAGASAGVGAGYILAEKKAEKKWSAIAEEEIASVKETYQMIRKGNTPEEEREAVRIYNERLDQLAYYTENGETDEGPVALHVVPSLPEEESREEDSGPYSESVDDTVEIISAGEHSILEKKPVDVRDEPRSYDHPYLITVDEYMEDEGEFDKDTVTYYEEDEVLVDESDEVVNVSTTTGTACFKRFGDGSDSDDTVYVRNEKINTDFEIVLNHGSYKVDILGLEPEPSGG